MQAQLRRQCSQKQAAMPAFADLKACLSDPIFLIISTCVALSSNRASQV